MRACTRVEVGAEHRVYSLSSDKVEFCRRTPSKMVETYEFHAIATIRRSGAIGQKFEFSERTWCSIGAHDDCDIRVIAERVAVLHALVTIPEGDEPLIYGLDEALPVLIPERDISLSNSEVSSLQHGDVFFVGERAFRFELAGGKILHNPDISVSAPVAPTEKKEQPVVPAPLQDPVVKTPRSTRSRRKSRKSRKSMIVTDLEEKLVEMPEHGPMIKKSRRSLAANQIAHQLIKDMDLAAPALFDKASAAARHRRSMPVFSGAFGGISVTYEEPVDAQQKLLRDQLNLMSVCKKKPPIKLSKVDTDKAVDMNENNPPTSPKILKVPRMSDKKHAQGMDAGDCNAGTSAAPQQLANVRTPQVQTSMSQIKSQTPKQSKIEHFNTPTRTMPTRSWKTPVRSRSMLGAEEKNCMFQTPLQSKVTDAPIETAPSPITHLVSKSEIGTSFQSPLAFYISQKRPSIASTSRVARLPVTLEKQSNAALAPCGLESDAEMTEDESALMTSSPSKQPFDAATPIPKKGTDVRRDSMTTVPRSLIKTPLRTAQRSAAGPFPTTNNLRTPLSARRLQRTPSMNRLTPLRHPQFETRGLATPMPTSYHPSTPHRLGLHCTPRTATLGPAIKKQRLPPRTPRRERADNGVGVLSCTPRSSLVPPKRHSETVGRIPSIFSESPRIGAPRRLSEAQMKMRTPKGKPGPAKRPSAAQREAREMALASTPRPGPPKRASRAQELGMMSSVTSIANAQKTRARTPGLANWTLLKTPTVDTYAKKLPELKSPSAPSTSPAKPAVNVLVEKTPGASLPLAAFVSCSPVRSPRIAKSPTYKATVAVQNDAHSPFSVATPKPSAVRSSIPSQPVIKGPDFTSREEHAKYGDEEANKMVSIEEFEKINARTDSNIETGVAPISDDTMKEPNTSNSVSPIAGKYRTKNVLSTNKISLIESEENIASSKTEIDDTEAQKCTVQTEPQSVTKFTTSTADRADISQTPERVVEPESPKRTFHRPGNMPHLVTPPFLKVSKRQSAIRAHRTARTTPGPSKTITKTVSKNPRTPSKVVFSGLLLEKGPHYSPRARRSHTFGLSDAPIQAPDFSSPASRHPAEGEREQRVVPGDAPSTSLARLGEFFFANKTPDKVCERGSKEPAIKLNSAGEEGDGSDMHSISSGSEMSVSFSESEGSLSEVDETGETSLSTDHTPRRQSLVQRISALFYGPPERPSTDMESSDCEAPTRTSASSEPAPEMASVPEPQSSKPQEEEFDSEEEYEEESIEEDSDDDVEVSPPRRRSLIGRAFSAVVGAAVSPARSLLGIGRQTEPTNESGSRESADNMDYDEASSSSTPGEETVRKSADSTPLSDTSSDARTVTPQPVPDVQPRDTASNLLNRFNTETGNEETDDGRMIDHAPLPTEKQRVVEDAMVNSNENNIATAVAFEEDNIEYEEAVQLGINTSISVENAEPIATEMYTKTNPEDDIEEPCEKVEKLAKENDTFAGIENTQLDDVGESASSPMNQDRPEKPEESPLKSNSETSMATEDPEPPASVEKSVENSPKTTPADYSKWTVKELRQYLAGLDIALDKGMRKADLILAAEKAESVIGADHENATRKLDMGEDESRANEAYDDHLEESEDDEQTKELRTRLMSHKVPYLRDLLRKCDMDDKGRKADLVENLLAESFKVLALIDVDEEPQSPTKHSVRASARKKKITTAPQCDGEEIEEAEESSKLESRRSELKVLTVKKLQVLLGKLKLDKTGRKDMLINRIIEAEFGHGNESNEGSDAQDEEMPKEPATPVQYASRSTKTKNSTVKKSTKKAGEDVSRMTVAQLRKFLVAHERCTNGLKPALLARAEDEQANQRRRRKFKDDFLCTGCQENDRCVGPN